MQVDDSDPLANIDKENTDVLMYCTGGIRCDVYSTMLRFVTPLLVFFQLYPSLSMIVANFPFEPSYLYILLEMINGITIYSILTIQ